MRTTLLILFGVFSVISLNACVAVDYDRSAKPVVFIDQPVTRPELQVAIRPEGPPPRELKALFVPFRVLLDAPCCTSLGREVGREVWRRLVAKRVFPVIEYYEAQPWRGGMAAKRLGQALGADIVIGGDVTHFLDGGSLSESALGLRLEAYDVNGGQLIWSMDHAGMLADSPRRDFVLWQTQGRLPDFPLPELITVLADEMATEMKAWHDTAPSLAAKDQAVDPDTPWLSHQEQTIY